MYETLPVDFIPYVSDVDPQSLTLGYSGNTNVQVAVNGLNVTFSALAGWHGSEDITFSVFDGYAYAYDTVTVTVNFVNTPPAIELPATFSFEANNSLIVDFTPYVNDVDLQGLILSCSGNTSVHVEIQGMIVTFTADADWFGEEVLDFFVSDGIAQTSDTVTVRVELVYLPAPPVTEIAQTTEGSSVGWEPVPNANLYRVYRSFDPYGTYELVGTTTSTDFDDWGIYGKAFYKIVAVYEDPAN